MIKNGIDCSVLLEINGLDNARVALEYMTELMRDDNE